MADFMIRFLICNLFISGIIGILLITKWIFKNNLSSRMQYNLWFLLLGLLTVPFIPFRLIGFPQIFSWLGNLRSSPASGTATAIGEAVGINPAGNTDWMNDFALSVNSETPSIAGYILLGIWIVGIFAMIILVIKSSLRLRTLEKSALSLQNPEVRRLYHQCLEEMRIHRNIPVYSTAFLKSPIIVGLLKPCIYLPIHLISDYNESDMRYMLLHELQHYKHKDAIASYLMNLAGVVYWFNPLVWYALKEMRNDREVACDTSVLKMLEEDAYEDYGNTLINFAEKVSLTPFPFAAGLGGNMKQMKRRIINIASYEKPTFMKRLKGMTAFMLTAVLLLGLAPILSTTANFEEEVLKSEIPVLVDFYADWCGPCQMMAPVIGQLAGEYEGRVKIGKLNVDENPDIAVQYKVMSIPTMIIFRNGEVFSKEVGASSKKEVEKAIGRAL